MRFFDIFLSLTLLIILSPLFLIITLSVKHKIGTPIFFKQLRPGKNKKPFLTADEDVFFLYYKIELLPAVWTVKL